MPRILELDSLCWCWKLLMRMLHCWRIWVLESDYSVLDVLVQVIRLMGCLSIFLLFSMVSVVKIYVRMHSYIGRVPSARWEFERRVNNLWFKLIVKLKLIKKILTICVWVYGKGSLACFHYIYPFFFLITRKTEKAGSMSNLGGLTSIFYFYLQLICLVLFLIWGGGLMEWNLT